MSFLSTGTLQSLRALNAAFICIVPSIFMPSEAPAAVCTLDVPRPTPVVCANAVDGPTCQNSR